jgi:MFS family permease
VPQAGTTIRHLLFRPDFRRLLGTRLASQFGDGIFQAALAGTVLFNPQRAADPLDVAAGFAVLLLPYSLVGPFAGVWLDRWSRRQVLLRANVLRAALVAVVAALVAAGVDGIPFYAAGLAVVSVNRFVLAALSAGLPHTTDEPSLVSANAFTTTAGSLATVVGGGAALVAVPLVGDGDVGYAALALCASLPYLIAAVVVSGFPLGYLGPDTACRSTQPSARDVAAGMVAGARHAWGHPPAAAALNAIGLHRICFGVVTLLTLLLYRNTLDDSGSGFLTGGPAGLAQVVVAGAAGALLGAVLTPRVVRRIGKPHWAAALLATAAATPILLGALTAPATLVTTGFVLGLIGQGVKICVDTTLQETTDDDYRGRVFSVYDTLVNVAFVAGLLAAAWWSPASGRSVPALAAVSAGYLVAAAVAARSQGR